MTKDVITAIEERTSIRKYKKDSVPETIITKILDAARKAPSAGNRQPWKFIVVYNEDVKSKLSDAALKQKFVSSAPVVIVVCAEPETSRKRFGERGENLYCIQDTAAATQNILLAATGYGLGTCWVGAFSESKVKECLELPVGLRPVAMVTVGYPESEEIKRSGRRSLADIVHIIK